MSDLLTERMRPPEMARARERAEPLSAALPEIVSERVGEHIQKLEEKLMKDFQQLGQRTIEESANVLNGALADRVETLEQISALQSRTITRLRDSSKIADRQVSAVVHTLERTLSDAVPGFSLELRPFTGQRIPATALVKADPRDLEQPRLWRNGFCPRCTSTSVRRANRSGMWEHLLRLFFIAPFRCRACRHKFYHF